MIGRGRGKGESGASGSQSWRELGGPARRKGRSPWVWKRRLRAAIQVSGVSGLLVVLCFGGVWLWQKARDNPEAIAMSAPSQPLERIYFQTDGALPDQWLSRTVDLQIGMNLMEIDIHGLKERLEAMGQVRSATVERVFPDALRIVIAERVPVLRLAVQSRDGPVKQQVVAEDGTAYKGIGYSRPVLRRLPFLRPYLHGDGSHLPLLGIPEVAALLRLAELEHPALFSTWEVVSLEHYSGDPGLPGQVIEVRTKLVPRILFGAGKDFGLQLNRLVHILKKVKESGNPSMERIDLSLRGLAAVQFSSKQVNIVP